MMLVKIISSVLSKRFLHSDFTGAVCRNSFSATEILWKPKSRKPNSLNCRSSKLLIFYNSQITQYGREGNLEAAESVFNRMPFKDVVSWTALLTAYADNGETEQARDLFEKMTERNIATWNAMITAYVRILRIVEASELFYKMPRRNVVSYTAMITGFLRVRMLSEAEKLYHEMPLMGRDPVASNALISAYFKANEFAEALRIFEGMLDRDVVSWSSMVDGYCKQGRINDARTIFEMMPERNVVSWTSMIDGYFKVGMCEEGFRMFLRMRNEGVAVNSTTLTVIFDACANWGRSVEGVQFHGLVISMGFEWDGFLGNSIISMYSELGRMDAAKTTFNFMTSKDIVSWNSLITGYVQNDEIEDAYALFEKMPQRDVVSWTAMVVGFMNTGRIQESISLFEEMPQKDDVAWTAVVSGFVGNKEYECAFWWFLQMAQEGFAQHGFGLEALELFREVEISGYKPNEITFLGVLSACAHVGLVEDGWAYFKSMRFYYCIEPGPDHYVCMVDLLGRAGLLQEAMELIGTMPFQPHSAVWGAILGASRVHKDLGLAKLAAKHLFEQVPGGATAYAVLSSMYSEAGLSKDEEELRMIKKSKRAKKNPGCSWVILKDKVHLFYAGNQSANFEEIHSVIRNLAVQMEEIDYNRMEGSKHHRMADTQPAGCSFR